MKSQEAMADYAERERELALHREGRGPLPCLAPDACAFERERNRAYKAYTGKPHPSTRRVIRSARLKSVSIGGDGPGWIAPGPPPEAP
jgi:hypothetical protein